MKTLKYKIGQWVRFYQAGNLVIGEIRYITENLIGKVTYSTDVGEVAEESIKEAR